MSQDAQGLPAAMTEEEIYVRRRAGTLRDDLGATAPRVIDLFSGAGGMTAGFSTFVGHVFAPVWANDFNESAIATYNANFGPHGKCGDLVDLLESGERVPMADVVIGGPPCQGFSLLNKRRDGDPRRHLWRPFMQVVELSTARVFVMENVPQLIGSSECEDIEAEAARQGFTTAKAILCAADYGVPQTRWRAFIIGARDVDPGEHFPPLRTHKMPEELGYRRQFNGYAGRYLQDPAPWITVRQAFKGLPLEAIGTEPDLKTQSRLGLHFGRRPTEKSLARYRHVPPGGNRFDLLRNAPDLTPDCWLDKEGGTDLFGRLWWDRPAVTIRTEFFKPEKGRYLHPTEHRPITFREAARLQSFPDKFKFRGTKTEIARQIGNAVPPMLAARVADAVLAILLSARDD